MKDDKAAAIWLGAITVLLGGASVLGLSINKNMPCAIGDMMSPLMIGATVAYGYATALAIKDIIKSKQTQR